MKKKGHSQNTGFGRVDHYDEKGNFIGYSAESFFGTEHFDENGKKTGSSTPGPFGTTDHFDDKGKYSGCSSPGFFGTTQHFDEDGKNIGESGPEILGSSDYYGEGDDDSYPYMPYSKTYNRENDKFQRFIQNASTCTKQQKREKIFVTDGMRTLICIIIVLIGLIVPVAIYKMLGFEYYDLPVLIDLFIRGFIWIFLWIQADKYFEL